jgi:hypothetical protein
VVSVVLHEQSHTLAGEHGFRRLAFAGRLIELGEGALVADAHEPDVDRLATLGRRHVDARVRLEQCAGPVEPFRRRRDLRQPRRSARPERERWPRYRVGLALAVRALDHRHVHIVARPTDRVRDADARAGYLRARVRELAGELQEALADLEQTRAAHRMTARLQSAREVHRHAATKTRDGMLERVGGVAAQTADQCVDRLVGLDESGDR